MSAKKTQTALDKAIFAASEFQLMLDVQPAGGLFNPGGKGDARVSASYALASLSLAEAATERRHGAERPGMVHVDVVPIVDVVADHRADMPADLLELLTSVAVILGKLGFHIPDQNSSSSKKGGAVEVVGSIPGDADVVIKKVKGELDAVHGVTSEKVVGRTLCHDQSLVDSLMLQAFDPSLRREPRSAAYKAGARAYLAFRLSGASRAADYVYEPGSEASDAYNAGIDEGRSIWARHQAKAAQ
jgi:hypothetical protein